MRYNRRYANLPALPEKRGCGRFTGKVVYLKERIAGRTPNGSGQVLRSAGADAAKGKERP